MSTTFIAFFFCLFFIFFCDLQKARRHSSVNYNAQFLSVTLSDPKKRNIFKLNYFSGYQIILAGFEWNTILCLCFKKRHFSRNCVSIHTLFWRTKKMSLTTDKKITKESPESCKVVWSHIHYVGWYERTIHFTLPLHCIYELKRKLPKNAFLVAMSHNVSEKSYYPPKKESKYACINIQLRSNPSLEACTYLNPPPIWNGTLPLI